jgi:hypothetical protein
MDVLAVPQGGDVSWCGKGRAGLTMIVQAPDNSLSWFADRLRR